MTTDDESSLTTSPHRLTTQYNRRWRGASTTATTSAIWFTQVQDFKPAGGGDRSSEASPTTVSGEAGLLTNDDVGKPPEPETFFRVLELRRACGFLQDNEVQEQSARH